MADTILAGRWVIYYEAENRQKRIARDTAVTPTVTDTVNALYSALQNQFDELTQMDDGIPMSAQTPTEYTIGIIDAGDKDPWFIDRTSVEYLTGGALKTASWDRVDGTNTGIVRMAYTIGTDFDTTDIGRDILMTVDGDRGTILDFNTTGATKFVWIRPDSNAAANSFDNAPTANGAWTIPNNTFSQVWQVVAAGPTFVDETADANSATAADWQIFPATEAVADYVAVGFTQKFRKVTFDSTGGTAGTVGVVVWEYWNGTAWAALTGVTDGTTGFTTAVGANQNLTFTVPTDWATTSLNGSQQLYYIRARVTTVYTINPVYSQGVIGSTGVGNQAGGAAVSAGESLWSNIYSIGTLEANTHIYIYQNAANLVAYKATTDWWGDGHIDILVNVKELGTETDEGVIKVYARQYSKTYSYYTVDLTAGGRNPLPLQTGNDLDNQTGYWQFTGSAGTGTFVVGEVISKSGTDKKGVLTAVAGTSSAPILTYYSIGDPIVNFASGDTAVTGATSGATCTAGVPAANGPSNLGANTPTVTFGGLATGGTNDIDENGTAENYSITLDCNQSSLANVYQWTKYVTRRGSTADIDTGAQTIEGQFYLGSETRIIYNTLTGTISDGAAVDQATTGFKGTVVNHNTTDKIIILRDSRGTFNQTGNIRLTSDPTNHFVTITGATPITSITPITAAPFGTFAGGKFFVAPGIVLIDYLTADANNFQLVTDNNAVVVAPTKVTLTVSNTRAADKVAVFRLTAAGGTIKKDRYNATVQSALATTAIMGSAITADEPGISAGGVLRLVDTSASTEYRIRFASWTASTFTLANTTIAAADAGTNTTTIVEAGAFATAKVGDLVINTTRSNAVSYITVVTDSNTVTISPAITGQTTGDAIQVNVLPVATTTTPQDTWYVPMIDVYETTGTAGTPGTETATVTYLADIPVRVRARNAGNIIPYEADSTVTNTGMSNSIIRTADTIFV